MPLAAADPDSAAAWARSTLPPRPIAVRFRWRYRDEAVTYAGPGTVRIAPPDSLRFDYSGPLGLGAGAAVIVGDDVVWADPARNFQTLVPAIPMLWASLGIVRPPGAHAAVFGLPNGAVGTVGEPRMIWRFVQGGDTLDFAYITGSARVLETEWRRSGRLVARSRTAYEGGSPSSARIDFPEAPARFELTVVEVDSAAVFPPALWRSRR